MKAKIFIKNVVPHAINKELASSTRCVGFGVVITVK